MAKRQYDDMDCMRAMKRADRLKSELKRARARIKELEELLTEAADELEDTKGYVGDYFWDKWQYGKVVEKCRNYLKGKK
jgi:chromosome segregation ATPase